MYVKLNNGLQKELIEKCIKKAGSERNLAKVLCMPKSSIYDYRFEKSNLPDYRFEKMLKFLGNDSEYFNKGIASVLEDSWGRRKGGKKRIENALNDGEFNDMIKNLRTITSKRLKIWHSKMRRENPELYYTTQYNKFKKIGGYKFRTLRGESVRNKLEKDVADFLYNKNILYNYEPYIKINRSVFFPDFKVGNMIIECTLWKGFEKSSKLKRKIRFYNKVGFHVVVVTSPKLVGYYKSIKNYLVTDLNKLPG